MIEVIVNPGECQPWNAEDLGLKPTIKINAKKNWYYYLLRRKLIQSYTIRRYS
jgi:hypothetical protein